MLLLLTADMSTICCYSYFRLCCCRDNCRGAAQLVPNADRMWHVQAACRLPSSQPECPAHPLPLCAQASTALWPSWSITLHGVRYVAAGGDSVGREQHSTAAAAVRLRGCGDMQLWHEASYAQLCCQAFPCVCLEGGSGARW
jgi:hypothetical protein